MDNVLSLPPLIILCAGKSERMGRPKGLLTIKDEYYLDYQVKNYSGQGGEKVIVVLGAHKNEYALTIPWVKNAQTQWTQLETNSVKVVINNEFEKGQFSSIQIALKEFIKLEQQFIFILPIDVPIPEEDVFYRMMSVLNKNTQAVIPEFFGKGGHPVLISKTFAKHLVSLDINHEDSRLDKQLQMMGHQNCSRVGITDPGIHLNINTPEKWADFIDNIIKNST